METTFISSLPSRVICLGEILYDCLANQFGQSLDRVQSWTNYPGGAPANTACALVKLGIPTAFIGCLAQDSLGDSLLKLLDNKGVNTQGIQRTVQFPTRQVYVLRSSTGDRSFAGFGGQSPDAFADAYLRSEHLLKKLFSDAEYLVIGTLELAYPHSRQAVFRALELADKYYLRIVLDVNHREKFWLDSAEAKPLIQKLWQYVDFLKLAQEEAQWLFNTDDAGAIYDLLGSVEGVVVTDGAAEVSYCISEQEGKVKPFSLPVKDTTGAGDAFLAGLIYQLCQRKLSNLTNPGVLQEIITYACAVGGLTTTKEGAISAQPTTEEVTAFLKKALSC
ncbi:PfkB protein [Hyella patelloides LEGE 07179]|uniref:PfkB protein n=1 Tax=Hyella patelloides LEGE 07179 TaxID=945734 RepID=A0A563VZQ0_9CYAN|nr:carbohydrate kinase [Hyella patelloides]VEP16938.1 PfkB protein [Hyella patelloides LEGE 07179]